MDRSGLSLPGSDGTGFDARWGLGAVADACPYRAAPPVPVCGTGLPDFVLQPAPFRRTASDGRWGQTSPHPVRVSRTRTGGCGTVGRSLEGPGPRRCRAARGATEFRRPTGGPGSVADWLAAPGGARCSRGTGSGFQTSSSSPPPSVVRRSTAGGGRRPPTRVAIAERVREGAGPEDEVCRARARSTVGLPAVRRSFGARRRVGRCGRLAGSTGWRALFPGHGTGLPDFVLQPAPFRRTATDGRWGQVSPPPTPRKPPAPAPEIRMRPGSAAP